MRVRSDRVYRPAHYDGPKQRFLRFLEEKQRRTHVAAVIRDLLSGPPTGIILDTTVCGAPALPLLFHFSRNQRSSARYATLLGSWTCESASCAKTPQAIPSFQQSGRERHRVSSDRNTREPRPVCRLSLLRAQGCVYSLRRANPRHRLRSARSITDQGSTANLSIPRRTSLCPRLRRPTRHARTARD